MPDSDDMYTSDIIYLLLILANGWTRREKARAFAQLVRWLGADDEDIREGWRMFQRGDLAVGAERLARQRRRRGRIGRGQL